MPSFLDQIKALNAQKTKTARTQLAPRRERRLKAREAAKVNKSAQEKAG